MTALQTPAPDAPAEEWGTLAERIPGWRWPDGMHWAAPGFVASATGSSPTSNVRQFVRVGFTPIYPDPDHWAWEGWMLRLVGGGAYSLWASAHFDSRDIGIGRGCISYAAALGRWPGGEG